MLCWIASKTHCMYITTVNSPSSHGMDTIFPHLQIRKPVSCGSDTLLTSRGQESTIPPSPEKENWMTPGTYKLVTLGSVPE
jgi:hypothetical protein